MSPQDCNRSACTGRRDYAVLLLLARLGLRAGEVVHMELDHLDWENGELMVGERAAARTGSPYPADVGAALAAYLRDGGPAARRGECSFASKHRSKVLPVPLPSRHRPTGLARAGLHPGCKGSHLLRHSLATAMLRGGAGSQRSARF